MFLFTFHILKDSMFQAFCEVLDGRATQAQAIHGCPGGDAPKTGSLLLSGRCEWACLMLSLSSHPLLGTDTVNGQNFHQGKWSS